MEGQMPIMVITGASSGVGRAAALRFCGEGYSVCALSRNQESLLALEAEGGGAIHAFPVDVRNAEQVELTFSRIISEHGSIDVLVNSAGVTGREEETSPAVIDRVIDTNLKGAMYCTFAALPSMRRAGRGSIFNIASIVGVDYMPEGSDGIYSASKHGLVAFSELAGKKYRKDGILVTTLCPGGIDTPLWNEQNPYRRDKREMIRPEEVADLISYILAQPRRTLFKNVIFVPVVEKW